ncbi:hypothetical protein MTO96_019860 [Rhipicephalus appendiculatus]
MAPSASGRKRTRKRHLLTAFPLALLHLRATPPLTGGLHAVDAGRLASGLYRSSYAQGRAHDARHQRRVFVRVCGGCPPARSGAGRTPWLRGSMTPPHRRWRRQTGALEGGDDPAAGLEHGNDHSERTACNAESYPTC